MRLPARNTYTSLSVFPITATGGGVSSHTHMFGDKPSGYELRAGRVYEIFECECGETKENALGTAATTLDLTGEVTEAELSAIGEGMVLITDNDNAQVVLDHIRSGCVVYFTAGTYTALEAPDYVVNPEVGYLRIRPSRYNGAVIYKGVWASGTGWYKGDIMESVDDSNVGDLSAINFYDLSLEDICFIGDDNAVFEVGFGISAGHIYQKTNGEVSSPYDAVKQMYLQSQTANSYYATICIDGIEFHNMHFKGDGTNLNFMYYRDDSYLRDVLIDSCSFTMDGGSSKLAAIKMNADNTGMYKDICVSDSDFRNVYQGVYVQGAENMVVENSRFDTTVHNAIAVQSGGSNQFSGEIRITGNTFANIDDRIIRFGNGSNADILISDNDFGTCTNADNHILKSETLSGCSGEFVNNLYKGSVMPSAEFSITDSSWIVEIPQ